MIGYLRGNIIARYDTSLLLDVQGVGYDIACTARTLQQLSGSEEISLHIYTQVREDSIKLFGFYSPEEKNLFLTLTKISGVGASVALALLSAMDANAVITAALASDAKAFTVAQGVGPKLASRLVNELRNMPDIKNASPTLPPSIADSLSNGVNPQSRGAGAEAIDALISLGYARSDAFRAVTAATQDSPEASAEQLITLSLRLL